jgi:hypothetical protein
MSRRRLAALVLPALALLAPLLAGAQALLPPATARNEWAVFRNAAGADGAPAQACHVCRIDPRSADCPGNEVARSAAPARCEAFAFARDMLRNGECAKVALRGFTVADCMPR